MRNDYRRPLRFREVWRSETRYETPFGVVDEGWAVLVPKDVRRYRRELRRWRKGLPN